MKGNARGPTILLCKARRYVCNLRISACQIIDGLLPVIDEFKESLFVGF